MTDIAKFRLDNFFIPDSWTVDNNDRKKQRTANMGLGVSGAGRC